jgi:multimeric flavodoxin WrbA
MKTLIVFYSFTGHTKAIAERIAGELAADIAEIKDIAKPGVAKAYIAGCFAAIRGKAWPIQALNKDPGLYEHLILLSPVWAGNTPPAVNAWLEQLPQSKSVAVKMISARGNSNCRERLERAVAAKSCMWESFEDIKA